MNLFKRIYCRTFQTVLRCALPVLPYKKPVVINCISDIPDTVLKMNCSRALIIADAAVTRLGLLDGLKNTLSDRNIAYFIYDKTVPNPTTDNVDEAYAIYKEHNCDFIIGFGGGSSIDCAKGVGIRVARPNRSLSQLKGILKVAKKLPVIVAIPTTAGSGSETTIAAVITDSATRHKYAINDFVLTPAVAVLDPDVTLSLPPFVTATTGMDALTHAVESYIGRSTTKETRQYSITAVKLIMDNLPRAYDNGNDISARRNMLNASYYAGCAFTKSYVGYVHAVAHSLGGAYNTPHGLANAMLLPYVLKAYGKSVHRSLSELAIECGIANELTPCDIAANAFIDKLEAMNRRFNIPDKLSDLDKSDIDRLVRYADKEANPLYPVPKLMDASELKQFYYDLLV